MIVHTVTFSVKHAPGSSEEEAFLKAGIALGSLPMVGNFQCYRQVGKKSNFTFGFSMEFASEQAYEAYNNHPDHVSFVETRWVHEIDDFMELDYVRYANG